MAGVDQLGRCTLLGKKVLIRPEEAKKQSEGGIYLPQSASAESMPSRGTVVKVGIDYGTQTPMGKKVVFEAYAGIPIQLDGQNYIIVDREDLLIII